MPFIFHSIIFLSYASMAAAVAVVLPRSFPGIDPNVALVVAGVVLVGCGLLHEVFARFEGRRTILDQFADLRDTNHRVMEELSRARGETRLIFEALEGAGRGENGRDGLKEVIAEVKVLEKLVEKLSGQQAEAQETGPAANTGAPVRRSDSPKVATGLDEATILDVVRDGLNSGRVDLFLQPVVSLPQRKHEFYECYSRIRLEDGSVILPDQYIGIAEKEGLITAIDNMLLFRCVQLVRKSQRRRRNVGFFCNISPRSLADKPFLSDFVDFMALNTELAGNLIFEFGQAALSSIDNTIVDELDRLAGLGFKFSVDQLSDLELNFADLARHRVKFIKVDAEILLSRVRTPPSGPDLRSLKNRLQRLGIDLIAEKIESEQILIELLDHPIDFGQGYLFGEPRLSRESA